MFGFFLLECVSDHIAGFCLLFFDSSHTSGKSGLDVKVPVTD